MDSHHLNLPASLGETQIKALPSKAYYISNFLTTDEEQLLLQKVRKPIRPCRFKI